MKVVIIARDVVINEEHPDGVSNPDGWHPIEGSLAALARLCNAGYRIIVTTSAPGLENGSLDLDDLLRIHEKLSMSVTAVGGHVDAIFFSPHANESGNRHRDPGLLQEVSARLGRDLAGIPTISNSLHHAQMALTAGAAPILIGIEEGDQFEAEALKKLRGVKVFPNLAAAVDDVLSIPMKSGAPE